MGLYTEITDAHGRRFQIKTGYDGFTDYKFKVGDTVPWRIDEKRAGCGHLLDGIYLAYPEGGKMPEGLFHWVVIDDHRILGVYEEPNLDVMESRFRIQVLPRETWSEEAWARKEEIEREVELSRIEFDAKYGHLPPMERMAKAASNLMRAAMESKSLSRRILPPQEKPDDGKGAGLMKARCNRTEECKKRFPHRDCGAWLVHDSSQCEPCPFPKPGNAECVAAYCSFDDTLAHSKRVFSLVGSVAAELAARGREHDASKMREPEKDYFDRFTPKLKGSVYGSDEYKGFLKELAPALKDHHYPANRHHPEHHENGMEDMNLLDLIEMLADWKAAGERHNDGNLAMSILLNEDREGFGMSAWHRDVLLKTAEDLGWWDGVMPEPCEKCSKPFVTDQDFVVCPKCREENVVHTIDRPEVPPQEAEITIEITKPMEEEKDGSD